MPERPTPDPLAAYLDEVRERWSKVAYVGLKPEVVPEPGPNPDWLPDVPRLLAALDAVLAKAAEWEARADEIDDHTGMTSTSVRAGALGSCAEGAREAISRELPGEGESGA